MNRALATAALVTLVQLLGGASAHALSCQNRLVIDGDAPARVRSLCGEPADIVERVVHRAHAIRMPGPGGTVIVDYVTVSILVQRWLYDFGPQRFMRALTFEDGRLVRVETLGYGTVR